MVEGVLYSEQGHRL